MRKLIVLLGLIATMQCAFAQSYDFYVKNNFVNIYYKITDSSISNRTVEVAYSGGDKYVRDVVIPSTVTYNGKKYKVTGIGQGAFQYCNNLTSVTIPNSVTYIAASAFYESNLKNIEIPESVISIGSNAFSDNEFLETVTFPNSVEIVEGNPFRHCSKLTHSVYNDKIFLQDVSKDTTATVPEGIKFIAGLAFDVEGRTITEVVLPSTVDSIGRIVIYGENIKTIILKSPTPPRCDEYAAMPLTLFETATVYVSNADPAILERYKADSYWSNFNIVATDLSGGGKDDGKQYADVNRDGEVNSADVVCVYNYIIGGDTPTLTKENADVNADNEVNSADIVAIYNYIIGGSNPRQ